MHTVYLLYVLGAIYGFGFVLAFIMGLFEQSPAVRNSYTGNGTNIEGAMLLIWESLPSFFALPKIIERRHARIRSESL